MKFDEKCNEITSNYTSLLNMVNHNYVLHAIRVSETISLSFPVSIMNSSYGKNAVCM